jgi:hypothetical protein
MKNTGVTGWPTFDELNGIEPVTAATRADVYAATISVLCMDAGDEQINALRRVGPRSISRNRYPNDAQVLMLAFCIQ